MTAARFLGDHLGTRSLLTPGREVGAESSPGQLDRAAVRLQVALRRGERTMPSDLPEHVQRYTGIRHPGEPRMP